MASKKSQPKFYELLQEEYGDYLKTKEKMDKQKDIAIPTGSFSLDVSIGIGGIPMQKFTEVYGPESSAKTTLALSISKQAMLMGYNVLYIDAEQAVDLNRAVKLGGDFFADEKKFTLLQPEFMEDALDLCERGIREDNNYGLVVLDSIASMTPKKVKEGNLDDSSPFILSQKLTRFVQRNIYNIRLRNVAFLGVNQVRDDTSNPYLKTYSTPGGHQWKHVCSLRIMLSKAEDIKQTIAGKEHKLGINSKFTIKKSKVGVPFRSFMIPIMFDTGIDYYQDAIEFSKAIGIIKQAGAFYVFQDETLGRGVVNASNYLKEHSDTLDKIKFQCYNLYNDKDVENIVDPDEGLEVEL